MPYPARKSPLRHLVWIVPLLALEFFFVRWLAIRPARRESPPPEMATVPPPPPPPPPPVWRNMVPPTPQTNLLNPDTPGVLQPTASGRLESAKFGSTRTAGNGSAVFHEGVDIAPVERDRKGNALDPIRAVADGWVAFVNNQGGKSNYGKYVVLEHPDLSLGMLPRRDGDDVPATVYTLYAHLSDIRFGIRPGRRVSAGEEIGTMGNTSNTQPPIPLDRSHLHWEIGFLLNSRYERWHRTQKLTPDFGNYHGNNLFGIDPLDFYAAHRRDPDLTMAGYLASVPPAWEIVLRGRYPDFFQRFPALWKGAPHDGGPLLLTIAESGLPLSGRNATAEEIAALGNQRMAVGRVWPEVLGRNGRGFIARNGGKWQVTLRGRQWVDRLLYF